MSVNGWSGDGPVAFWGDVLLGGGLLGILGLLALSFHLSGGQSEPAADRTAISAAAWTGGEALVYADVVTGCEYLMSNTGGMLTPRLGVDGGHMGCKAAGRSGAVTRPN